MGGRATCQREPAHREESEDLIRGLLGDGWSLLACLRHCQNGPTPVGAPKLPRALHWTIWTNRAAPTGSLWGASVKAFDVDKTSKSIDFYFFARVRAAKS